MKKGTTISVASFLVTASLLAGGCTHLPKAISPDIFIAEYNARLCELKPIWCNMSETPNTRVMRIKVSLLVSEKSFTKQMASLEMQTYMREIVEIAVGQSDSSNWHKYRNEGPGDFRKLRDNIKVLGNKKFLDKQISALLVDVFIDEFTVQ